MRVYNGKPVDVTAEEIEGEKLQYYIANLCFKISELQIPFGGITAFDDNLKPTDPNNKRCLTPDTLAQYIGHHLLAIRDKFPGRIAGKSPEK